MRTPPSLDTLPTLRRTGRSPALVEPRQRPDLAARPCEERVGLLGDRARTARAHRRRPPRWRQAPRRQPAGSAALDERHPWGVDTSLLARRVPCPWGRAQHTVWRTGPPGRGHTWRGWAWGPQACRDGVTALALRLPRGLHARPVAPGDGRDGTRRTTRATSAVWRREDGGLAPCSADKRRAGRASVDERHDRRATLRPRQLPVEPWHAAVGAPTLADALLDRLGHTADTLPWHGASRRKRPAQVTRGAVSDAPEPPGVALRRRWQVSPGMGGNLPMDCVADIRGICTLSHRAIFWPIEWVVCIRFVLTWRPAISALLTAFPRTTVLFLLVGIAHTQAFLLHVAPPTALQRHTGRITTDLLLPTRRFDSRR